MKINYRLNTAKLAGIRDEAAWAESMGCVGIRVASPEEVPEAIAEANHFF